MKGQCMKPGNIDFPIRLDIARIPTPFQIMRRLSDQTGIEIFIKRDDLTGSALSGNKIRKLEFALADAKAKGCDTVITCGGEQSNHCRATAVAATMTGMKTLLLLRTADPENPPAPTGNLLMDKMSGADILWITPDEYKQRAVIFEREAEKLRAAGRTPYIVPEGASYSVGAWGYIGAFAELAEDIAMLSDSGAKPVTIIHACGSGGTAAGLILGSLMMESNVRIISVNVCDDREYFVNAIGNICEDTIREYNLKVDFDRSRHIEILDGYVGRGYALSRPDELSRIIGLSRMEGIFLDPVYTGKAYHAMMTEIEKDKKAFGDRIVFIHTGGIFGLFPKSDELAPLL